LEEITFLSEGIRCKGDLFIPENCDSDNPRPAIVVGHGFSGVKEVLKFHGQFFCDEGYVVLTIDYRTFGRSEGEPRGQLFPLRQVEDYKNAITWLQQQSYVMADQIGIWGTSYGGGIVIQTAAFDRRVKCVVSQVPIMNSRKWMRSLRTGVQWEELLDRIDQDRSFRAIGKETARIDVVCRGSEGEFCAMPSDDDVELVEQWMSSVGTHKLDIAMESMEKIIEFNPSDVIHLIAPRPLLIVTAGGYDVIHPIDQIYDGFAKAHEPKKMIAHNHDQFGFYEEPGTSIGLKDATDWFQTWIPIDGSGRPPQKTPWLQEAHDRRGKLT
jgi:alpha/beta superfamily hydrolase